MKSEDIEPAILYDTKFGTSMNTFGTCALTLRLAATLQESSKPTSFYIFMISSVRVSQSQMLYGASSHEADVTDVASCFSSVLFWLSMSEHSPRLRNPAKTCTSSASIGVLPYIYLKLPSQSLKVQGNRRTAVMESTSTHAVMRQSVNVRTLTQLEDPHHCTSHWKIIFST